MKAPGHEKEESDIRNDVNSLLGKRKKKKKEILRDFAKIKCLS